MNDSFLPDKEAALVQWANNFVSYAVTRPTQTGLATTVVTEFSNRRTDYQNSILLTETARATYHAYVKTKAIKQKSVEDYARYLNQLVQGNPAVTDETKLGLGLTIKKKREKREPEIPKDLTVKATGRGDNYLHWNPNGNPRGSLYEVWAKYGSGGGWQYLEGVNGVTLTDKTAPAYEQVTYKVRAKVSGKWSKFSNEAALTSIPESILTLKKAA